MAVDDDSPKILRRVQKFLSDPKQVIVALPIERDIRPDARMGKEIIAKMTEQLEPFIETEMILRQHGLKLPLRLNQPSWPLPERDLDRLLLDTVRQKRRISAIAKPIQAGKRVIQERKEKGLVIAFEVNRRAGR